MTDAKTKTWLPVAVAVVLVICITLLWIFGRADPEEPPRCSGWVRRRLKRLHEHTVYGGCWVDELPEQALVLRWVRADARVLEIGGNIGRVSICLASVMHNRGDRLVVLESDPGNSVLLQQNRDARGLNFDIETLALSAEPLMQQGWNTVPIGLGEIPVGWSAVKTISYDKLCEKYTAGFDTLVLDCEGAFYYILRDTPEILDGVHTVCLENDFEKEEEEMFVLYTLMRRGFRVVEQQRGWVTKPHFYQMWIRPADDMD
jgi:FkbM family methyltransferase